MKYFALLVAASPALALATWSNPSIIADITGEQVQTKVKTTIDGSTYISWFSSGAGGYDVYLQRLDKDGNEMWPHGGILVADLSNSSTQDYDLAVDNQGNAYLAFQDTRVATITTASIAKISPAGTPLWGPNGVNLSNSLAANQPKVCVLDDGTVVGGFTGSSTITLRRYDTLGNLIGSPFTFSETSRAMTLSDLEAGDGSNVIAMWMRATGSNAVTSNKWLYAQKFSSANAPLWTGTAASGTVNSGTPVIVFNGNSIQNGTFPSIIPDGNGGFVTSWYETGGSRHAYFEHFNPDGSRKFGSLSTANVTSALATVENLPGRIQISASLAYDRWSGTYYVSSDDSSTPTQGNYSIIVQKFDRAGNRQWPTTGTKNGITIQPIDGNQKSFQSVQFYGSGALVCNMNYIGSFPVAIYQAALDKDGNEIYGVTTVKDAGITGPNKARLWTTLSPSGDAIAAWTDGPSGSGDVHAVRLGSGGRVGNGANRVTGHINASDYSAPIQGVNWIVTLQQGAAIETRMVRTDALGDWSIDTDLTGTAEVTVDGSHWTRRRVTVPTLGTGTVTTSMTNGDVDDSGEVDAVDIDIVIAKFGGVLYTVGYDLNADVDGSGEIDAVDIDIVIANFGATDE